jgi:hypothetical protein
MKGEWLFAAAAKPGADEARAALQKILSEWDGFNSTGQASGSENQFVDFIDKIMQFFTANGTVVIIILIVIFCLLFFLVVKNFLPVFKKEKRIKQPAPINTDIAADNRTFQAADLYTAALSAAGSLQYNTAVVCLYRACRLALIGCNLLIPGIEYTNSEIRIILSANKDFHTPFMQLAGEAEKILFRNDSVNREAFIRLLTVFEGAFLRNL